MAPRLPETKEGFLARFAAAAAAGHTEIRFGHHHFTHAVCLEDGVWRLRRLVTDPAKGAAYPKEHGIYMPEHAELLAEPGPEILVEAATTAAMVDAIGQRWPL